MVLPFLEEMELELERRRREENAAKGTSTLNMYASSWSLQQQSIGNYATNTNYSNNNEESSIDMSNSHQINGDRPDRFTI